MSQTRDQKRFTVSEVAADWHELMILQRTMAIHCLRQQTAEPMLQSADIPLPQSAALGLYLESLHKHDVVNKDDDDRVCARFSFHICTW